MLKDTKISSYMRQWLESHRGHLQDMRSLASRSVVQDVLDILIASLIGGLDFLTEPDNRVADVLFTTLWRKRVERLAMRGVRSWLVTGVGGVAVTPLGVDSITAERFAPLGTWDDPTALIFRRILHLEDARKLFPAKHLGELAVRFRATLPAPVISGIGEFYNPQVVEIDEVLHNGEWHYYCHDRLLGTMPQVSDNDFYVLYGDTREDTGEQGAATDFPVSTVEKLHGSMKIGDVDLIRDYEDALSALVALAKMQSLAFVRKGSIIDEQMVELLERNYKVIWHADADNPVSNVVRPSLQELLAALEKLEQQFTSRTGVSPYQRGVAAPSIQYATEAALLQQNTNIRIQMLAHQIANWLNTVIEAVRQFWVWQPADEQESVSFIVDGTHYTFGAAMPYETVLRGIKVTAGNLGFQDMMTRRMELLQAMQAASIVPTRYDLGKLADALLKTYRIDPTEVMNYGTGEGAYPTVPADFGLGE